MSSTRNTGYEESIIQQLKSKTPDVKTLPTTKIELTDKLRSSILYFVDHFSDSTIMTSEKFVYFQDLLMRVKFTRNDKKLRDAIQKTFVECQNFADTKRADLVPYIKPYFFELLPVKCWANNSELASKIDPINFENASKNKIDKIAKVLLEQHKTSQRGGGSKLTAEQKNAIINNKNLSLQYKQQLEKIISQKPIELLDITIPSTEKEPTIVKKTSLEPPSPVSPKSSNNIVSSKNSIIINEKNISGDNINNEINNVLEKIRNHLRRFDEIDKSNLPETSETEYLLIGDEKISIQCILHYLSDDPTFLPESRNNCSDLISKYLSNNKLNLASLIKLPENIDFVLDSKFYHNLYNFNISMIKFISQKDKIKTLSTESQKKLLLNLREFIKQTLRYLNLYMEKYKVIDDKLINSSYNLLYLLNTLTLKNAMVGKSIDDLQIIYTKLVDAITQNINLYKSIDVDKLGISQNTTSNSTLIELASLSDKLKQRLDILEKQSLTLKENVNEINKNSNNLEKYADDNIKELAKSLETDL